jgi:type IV secretion system protein VirB1
MILPLSVVLQLASQPQCVPHIAEDTVIRIAKKETGTQIGQDNWIFDPLAIHVNKDRIHNLPEAVYHPKDTEEAISIARRLQDEGRSFDAGITQINNKNMAWLGILLEQVFDPCKAMAASAALLISFSRYNTGNPIQGFYNGYVSGVALGAEHASLQSASMHHEEDAQVSIKTHAITKTLANSTIADDSTVPDTSQGYVTFPNDEGSH